MMGAVLQAPLAALMALLELTHMPHILLPGMLAVVVSCLTARQLCRCDGFFISVKRHGLHPLQQPLMQALSRVSVPAVMERSLVRTRRRISETQARALLEAKPVWIIIERSTDDKPTLALKAADLARYLLEQQEQEQQGQREKQEHKAAPVAPEDQREASDDNAAMDVLTDKGGAPGGQADVIAGKNVDRSPPPVSPAASSPDEDKEALLDLLEIPGQRLDLVAIHLQATLTEALNVLNESKVDGLYVEHGYRPKQKRISGIITRDAIERYYRLSDPSTA
jgi:hypothetical protein